MPNEVNGLPVHILLVHGVVVLVPLCALLLVAAAVLPSIRARLGVFLPLLALGCAALVPVTTHAGEWLQERVGRDPLVARHAHLGGQLLPWTLGLLVLSLAVWWLGRREPVPAAEPDRVPVGSRGAAAPGLVLQVAVAVLAVAVAAGSVVQVVRIGESGSKAVWNGVADSR